MYDLFVRDVYKVFIVIIIKIDDEDLILLLLYFYIYIWYKSRKYFILFERYMYV